MSREGSPKPPWTSPDDGTNKLEKELTVIRNPLEALATLSFSRRRFRTDFRFIYGAFYALLIFSMSGGLLGTSTADHAASKPSSTQR